MDKHYLEITEELSVADFQTIVAFVLKSGDRKFYCNKYNYSPHYNVGTFEIYLDPISQFINVTKNDLSNNVSDYNTIVIHDPNSEIQYYHLTMKNAAILLDFPEQKDSVHIRKIVVDKYIPAIKNAIH
jgi:hypothetical protein